MSWVGSSQRTRRQSGAYAIEFALVFVVFFIVLYAILTYGFIFMAQQSLNRAANTGARALLVWQGAGDMASRVIAAEDQINSFAGAGWVRRMAGIGAGGGATVIQTSVCIQGQGAAGQVDPLGVCTAFDASPQGGAGSDGETPSTGALVVVRYDYQRAPLIPILGAGLLSLPVPVAIKAQAHVDLSISYPGQPEAQ